MINVKKILYPTDFSSYSNQAYFHAITLAESHKASLTVLYVYNPDPAKETASGLGKVCYASCKDLLTRDQALFLRTIGVLSDAAMQQIEACLRQVLGIP